VYRFGTNVVKFRFLKQLVFEKLKISLLLSKTKIKLQVLSFLMGL